MYGEEDGKHKKVRVSDAVEVEKLVTWPFLFWDSNFKRLFELGGRIVFLFILFYLAMYNRCVIIKEFNLCLNSQI